MEKRQPFRREDIGGEILPILTTGLYRDTLDALREYIQNAIDANSTQIELIIDPDTVVVSDNGKGMTFEEANNAKRLGISNKNPLENIGFRGIGIYSAFNICNNLEIFTKSEHEKSGYVIHFDFAQIRKALLEEQIRRENNLPSSLYLERMLGDTVYLEKDEDRVIQEHGTKAIMSGLLSEVYKRLNNWDEVVSYLQDVVPLPFRGDFKFGEIIEKKFRQEDYRVVPLTLKIGLRHEPICRPYHNNMFTHGGEYPPKPFELKDRKEKFGFAWICINDSRDVLKDVSLRGLLIKKFDFSIANRRYLEPYFGRTVFNRRITGELIIQHPNLIPNAARSDFEHNSTRQAFLEALPNFIKEVSRWANEKQEVAKAKEVLAEVSNRLDEINKSFPAIQRDRESLLNLNVKLADLSREIRPYIKTLKKIEPDSYEKTDKLLNVCQTNVKDALLEHHKARRNLEKRAIRSIQEQSLGPTEEEKKYLHDIPSSIIGLIESYDLTVLNDVLKFLQFLDENIIKEYLTDDEYRQMLLHLREFLEGNL